VALTCEAALKGTATQKSHADALKHRSVRLSRHHAAEAQRRARLYFLQALRESTDERRWHVFQRAYERALVDARRQLSETDWSSAWAARRALTAAQAVAEALEEADTAQGSEKRLLLVGSSPI
jgi:hypothetical protein